MAHQFHSMRHSMRLARLAKGVRPVDVAVALHARARAAYRLFGGQCSASSRRTPMPYVVQPGTGECPGPQRCPVAAAPQGFTDEQSHQQNDAQQGHGTGEQFFDHGVSASCGAGEIPFVLARVSSSGSIVPNPDLQSGLLPPNPGSSLNQDLHRHSDMVLPGKGVTESRSAQRAAHRPGSPNANSVTRLQ